MSSTGTTSSTPTPDVPAIPERVLELARDAHRVTVLTGAGMSAESGVPTYRDAETGLWARYDAQSLSTINAWHEDPQLVWTFHAFQAGRLDRVVPNAGHEALSRWQRALRRTGGDLTIATQNIDDLHERAGSEVLTHAHGRLRAFLCSACGAPYEEPIAWPDEATERQEPPTCPRCGEYVRPDVVLFGEMLPTGSMESAAEACENADVVFVVGTSAIVYPFAGLPLYARSAGVPVVEVNPSETGVTDLVDEVWRETAARALPALVDAVVAG